MMKVNIFLRIYDWREKGLRIKSSIPIRQYVPETYPGWTLAVTKMIDFPVLDFYLYALSVLSSMVSICKFLPVLVSLIT